MARRSIAPWWMLFVGACAPADDGANPAIPGEPPAAVEAPGAPPRANPEVQPDDSAEWCASLAADVKALRHGPECADRADGFGPADRDGSGRYWIDTEGVAGCEGFRILVCSTVPPNVVSRIDPNPGGVGRPSVEASLVAGNNVLIEWGCGSNCGVVQLFTRFGTDLPMPATIVDVSPDRAFAIGIPEWIPREGAEVSLLDLRTGRALRVQHVDEYVRTVRWLEHEVVVELEQPPGSSVRFRTDRR